MTDAAAVRRADEQDEQDEQDEFAVRDRFVRAFARSRERHRLIGVAVSHERGQGDLSVLDDVYRTNLRGTFVVDQQAVRRLRPGGSIVNFRLRWSAGSCLRTRPTQPPEPRSRQ